MLALFCLAATVSAPPADEANLGGALLSAAAGAEASGDVTTRDRWLRAWASVGGRPVPPDALAAAATEAQRWSQQKGALRVFGSREGDRLKLGLHDPAGIVTRIEAVARSGDRATILARTGEEEASGRIELLIDPTLGPDARFEITTWCDLLGEPYVVRFVAIGSAGAAPVAPDPKSVRGAPPRSRAADPGVAADDAGEQLPWWWVVAGVVAVGLAGAAVWQETR